MITFGQVELSPAYVLLRGERATLRIGFDSDVVQAHVKIEEQADLAEAN